MKNYQETRNLLLTLYKDNLLSYENKLNIYNEYIYCIRKLAYIGNFEAQYDLAQHYEDSGFWGCPNPYFNNKKRFYWYLKSANNGNGEAFNNLADLFERGDGCIKDLDKSITFYKKAMELGSSLGKKNYKKMLKDFENGGIYFKSSR